MEEFRLPLRVTEPLVAEIQILPQDDGVLFRGRLTGQVVLPCDRCAGDSTVVLDTAFDSFEQYPPLPGTAGKDVDAEELGEVDEAVIRLSAFGGAIEINPAALAWQEFSLALPLKPLCAPACKGLCPLCGCDRNTEHCACDTGGADPRMAVLRGLTVQKK